MEQKYAVINPMTGQYAYYATKDEALVEMARISFEFFLSQTHNQPIAKVTVNDGSETWSGLDGSEMLSPEQVRSQVLTMSEEMAKSFAEAQEMPVTKL